MDCPSKGNHPFWYSDVGSYLNLRIKEPPESQIKGIDITVISVRPSYYKLSVFLCNENYKSERLTKKQTIDFLKNEWMNIYKDKTIVDYKILTPVDMSKFVKPSPNSISLALQSLSLSSDSSRDSSPRSPDYTPRTPR